MLSGTYKQRWNLALELNESQSYDALKNAFYRELNKLCPSWKKGWDKEFDNLFPPITKSYTVHKRIPIEFIGIYHRFEITTSLKELLNNIELFLNFINSKKKKAQLEYKNQINNFINNIIELISLLNINVDVIYKKNKYSFVSSNSKLDFIIKDNLDYLCTRKYDSVLKSYKLALKKHLIDEENRVVLDNLRHSLEQLFRIVLNNKQPLEKNIAEFETYLKKRGCSSEIRSLLHSLLTYFINYQNDRVKHGDNINPEDLKLLLYLTSIFINYIILNELNKKEE